LSYSCSHVSRTVNVYAGVGGREKSVISNYERVLASPAPFTVSLLSQKKTPSTLTLTLYFYAALRTPHRASWPRNRRGAPTSRWLVNITRNSCHQRDPIVKRRGSMGHTQPFRADGRPSATGRTPAEGLEDAFACREEGWYVLHPVFFRWWGWAGC
jgi:hypothetical protein